MDSDSEWDSEGRHWPRRPFKFKFMVLTAQCPVEPEACQPECSELSLWVRLEAMGPGLRGSGLRG